MEYLVDAPIIYESDEDFEILNPSHLHSHILSTVFKSRTHFSYNKLGLDLRKMFEEGYGFYVTHANVISHKNLSAGKHPVHVRSFVKRYFQRWESSRVHVPFEITDLGSGELLTSGALEFAVVDTKEAKSKVLPIGDWKYFVHDMTEAGPKLTPLEREALVRPKPLNIEMAQKIARRVQDHEIDMYQHVGTTNYIRYIFDTLENPTEYKQSRILFKRSLLKDNDFVILKETTADGILFEIRDPTLKTIYNVGSLLTRP